MHEMRPTKRVREAFNRDALRRVCEMHERAFGRAYDLTEFEVHRPEPSWSKWAAPKDADFYLFRDNGADILAVAHLDTVAPHATRTCRFIDTEAGPVVFSRALDDRLGAYTILELLPKLGVNVDILLTVGEETGNSTAEFFEPTKNYNWIIEFDRGGTDVVMYDYDDLETRDLVKECGADVGIGSFTDICYLEHLEVKGFNWGVGYRGDYHGPRAHAFLEDYWMMIGLFLKFHAANATEYLPHESVSHWRQVEEYEESLEEWWQRWKRARGDDMDDDPDDPDYLGDDPVSEDFGLVNGLSRWRTRHE